MQLKAEEDSSRVGWYTVEQTPHDSKLDGSEDERSSSHRRTSE